MLCKQMGVILCQSSVHGHISGHVKKGVSEMKHLYWVQHVRLPYIGVINGMRQKIGMASNAG